MATVKLRLMGKKNPTKIYLRFINGRAIDIQAPTNILINPDHWDKIKGKLRNLIEIPDRNVMNAKLDELKIHVIKQYNNDYMLGEIIDQPWLEKSIGNFFNRPKKEENQKIKKEFVYYSKFAEWWLENKAQKWKIGKKKYLGDNIRLMGQYESFLNKFKEQFDEKGKIKLKDFGADLINDYITQMEEVEGYADKTIKRRVGRLKFFLARAQKMGLFVKEDYDEPSFVREEEEILEPYLPEEEIERIFNYDFSQDESLENARDCFIIGLWTGLRISDFNHNLDISHISDDYIEIKTEKTGAWVSIPVHPHVKAILNKRFGLLPQRISDQKFNKRVKKICEEVGLTQEMKGKILKKVGDKIRKVSGVYPKYKLVSSHICRRSFATNLYGTVPNHVIQSVGGWKTEAMMLHYIKKSKREHAEVLKLNWDKKYNTNIIK